MQTADQQPQYIFTRTRLDPAVIVRRVLPSHKRVCELPAKLHPTGAAGLRSLL